MRRMLSRQNHSWYNDDIHHTRKLRRINEKTWRKTGLEIHRQIFVQHQTAVTIMIQEAKCNHVTAVLSNGDSKTCFLVINSVFKSIERKFLNTYNMETLCSECASYFSGKVIAIRKAIDCRIVDEGLVRDNSDVNVTNNVQLIQLAQTTDGEIEKIIKQCP